MKFYNGSALDYQLPHYKLKNRNLKSSSLVQYDTTTARTILPTHENLSKLTVPWYFRKGDIRNLISLRFVGWKTQKFE